MEDNEVKSDQTGFNKKNHIKINGGPRPNSGRKPGSTTLKTREVADRILKSGKSPLEVLFYVMNEHLDRSKELKQEITSDRFVELSKQEKNELKVGYYSSLSQAAMVAKDCAPYVHAKLQPVEVKDPEAKNNGFNLNYSPEQIKAAVEVDGTSKV